MAFILAGHHHPIAALLALELYFTLMPEESHLCHLAVLVLVLHYKQVEGYEEVSQSYANLFPRDICAFTPLAHCHPLHIGEVVVDSDICE